MLRVLHFEHRCGVALPRASLGSDQFWLLLIDHRLLSKLENCIDHSFSLLGAFIERNSLLNHELVLLWLNQTLLVGTQVHILRDLGPLNLVEGRPTRTFP